MLLEEDDLLPFLPEELLEDELVEEVEPLEEVLPEDELLLFPFFPVITGTSLITD